MDVRTDRPLPCVVPASSLPTMSRYGQGAPMSNEYEAPRLIDLGSVSEVTAQNANGARTDADFPAGTPMSDLTFS